MKNKQIITLYLKNNETNWMPISQQTMNIREDTNQKIRLLGNKYYVIKNLLDQMNIKRDDLFQVGRELEEELKDQKNIYHLQKQKRRMKDAIYVWFTENFFIEILEKNPVVMTKLYQMSKNSQKSNNLKVKLLTKNKNNKQANSTILTNENRPKNQTEQSIQNSQDFENDETELSIQNSQKQALYHKKHEQNTIQIQSTNMINNNNMLNITSHSFLNNMKMNQEIDSCEYFNNNITLIKNDNASTYENQNFDFESMLNF